MRSWATVFWLATTGCLAGLAVPAPEVGDDAETLIVHVRSGSEERIWVSTPGSAAALPASILADDANIRAYALAYSPSALQLPLGLQPSESGSRRLPHPLQSWQGEVSEGELGWKPTTPDPSRDTFGLPPVDWALCLEQQGCAPPDPEEASYCSQACAAASPARPAPPKPPEGMSFVAQGQGETLTYVTPLPPAQACPDGEAQAYGAPECAPVGPCSQGWPDPSPAGTTWYVEHGGTGLGTLEAPFTTVAEALGSSRPGDTILIGPGDYPGPRALQGPVTLRGRCPAETSLSSRFAMQLSGQDLVVSDLRLPEIAVIGGTVRLQRVTWLEVSAALSQEAGELIITDALAQRITGGAFISRGGNLSMSNVVIDGTLGTGIQCNHSTESTHCNLRRTAVRNFSAGDLEPPRPAIFMHGATFEIQEFIIEDGTTDGLLVEDASIGTVSVGLIRNLTGSGLVGRAIRVRRDAQLNVQDLFVSRVSTGALNLSTRGTVYARDIVVLDTQNDGATIRLRPADSRLLVERAYVSEEGSPLLQAAKRGDSIVELSDIRYLSGSTAPDQPALLGLHDTQAILRRAHISSSGAAIIDMVSSAPGPTLALVDVRTEGGEEALRVDSLVTIEASRVHFSGLLRGGIVVPRPNGDDLGSVFIGEDITIELAETEGLLRRGNALEVGPHGEVEIERFALLGPALVGANTDRFGRLQLSGGIISGPELGLRIHEDALSDLEDALRTVRIETPFLHEIGRD